MRRSIVGLSALVCLAGCAAGAKPPAASPPSPPPTPTTAAIAKDPGAARASDHAPTAASNDGAWLHASPESDLLLASSDGAYVGVWIDAPEARTHHRSAIDLALVIDTSGSMEGDKMGNARSAAKTLVENLADGDVVSIDTFSDSASTLVAPTRVDAQSRARVIAAIERLEAAGGTDMFDGLQLAESHVAMAQGDPGMVRRIVMISDGIANVGPSSPEELASLAGRSLVAHAQVTSLGVGNDYDERTLDAIAVRTSGRMFHIGDPREMVATLKHELDLLGASVANDAVVEVVPAPGVRLEMPEMVRADWSQDGALRIPIGTLFAGQHREALIRARFTDPAAAERSGGAMPLASVRLFFRDPNEGNIERVQEVVARAGFTSDTSQVAAHANARCHAIMAVLDAGKLQVTASQRVSAGDFASADRQLAAAEKKLRDEAQASNDKEEQARLNEAAAGVAHTRAATQAVQAAPPAAQRGQALEMNHAGMADMGY